MLKQVILTVFTLFCVSLTFAQKMSIGNHIKRIDVSTLPLFCDKTEVSNAEYRQYTTWVYATFGNEAYEKALPDSLVWNWVFGEPFVPTYFRHPAYNNYPVVGVSYEQALAYIAHERDLRQSIDELQPLPESDAAAEWTDWARAMLSFKEFLYVLPLKYLLIISQESSNFVSYVVAFC